MSTLSTSVVIPLWNGMDVLPACLQALRLQQPTPDEIILVDDGSSDGAAEWVSFHYPDLILIRHPKSLGFVHAANRGLAAASGDVTVLLNQDTEVCAGWLSALLSAARLPDVALVGSRVLNLDGTLQHAAGTLSANGATQHLAHPSAGPATPPLESEWLTGASLAITRAAYEQLGPLDERFAPAYYEDVEWCLRARVAGLRVLYAPASTVMHHAQSRLQSEDESFMRLYQGNRLKLVCKHWSQEQITSEFLPAELTWLQQLGEGSERLIAVMHELYIEHLLLSDIYANGRAAEHGPSMLQQSAIHLIQESMKQLVQRSVQSQREAESQLKKQHREARQQFLEIRDEVERELEKQRLETTRQLGASHAEIVSLHGLVQGYENGRFMRLMRTLKRVQSSLGRTLKSRA